MPSSMTPATYRKKPVTVEALRFTKANMPRLNDWLTTELGAGKFYFLTSGPDITLHIETAEGDRDCPAGYWVVKGTHGEFYPVSADVFATVYEFEAAS